MLRLVVLLFAQLAQLPVTEALCLDQWHGGLRRVPGVRRRALLVAAGVARAVLRCCVRHVEPIRGQEAAAVLRSLLVVVLFRKGGYARVKRIGNCPAADTIIAGTHNRSGLEDLLLLVRPIGSLQRSGDGIFEPALGFAAGDQENDGSWSSALSLISAPAEIRCTGCKVKDAALA